MPDPVPPPTRSQTLFSQAAPEVKQLVRQIMEKERTEQHKRSRTEIYQTLLQYVKESTQ